MAETTQAATAPTDEPSSAPSPTTTSSREPADATLLLSLSRQLEAAHRLIEEMQHRLDAQATELYLARSDQQRSAALADEFRAKLHEVVSSPLASGSEHS